jgi:Na+/H+-dicarboxylate symporter
MSLCKYKNILGEPGKGIHSIRLFNISIIDVLLTFVLAWILNIFIKTNYFVVLVFCFCLGIILHKLFCVDTTIGKLLKK